MRGEATHTCSRTRDVGHDKGARRGVGGRRRPDRGGRSGHRFAPRRVRWIGRQCGRINCRDLDSGGSSNDDDAGGDDGLATCAGHHRSGSGGDWARPDADRFVSDRPTRRPASDGVRNSGTDGQPNGATVEGDRLSLQLPADGQDLYTVGRSARSWIVNYEFPPDAGLPESDGCVLCATAHLGPDDSVVLIDRSPTTDGDLQSKLTVLSDQVTTYDTDWDFIGLLGGKMLFDRLDHDSIDFGTVEV